MLRSGRGLATWVEQAERQRARANLEAGPGSLTRTAPPWRRRSAGNRPFSGVANAPPHSAVESGAGGRRQPAREGQGRASLPLVCWKAGGRKRANRPKGPGKAAGAVPVGLHLVQDHHRRGHAPPSLPPPAGSDGGGSQARPRVMMVENSPRSATFDQAGACQNGVAASDRRGCTPLHARRAGYRPGRFTTA